MRMRIFFGKSKFRNDFVCVQRVIYLYFMVWGLGDWGVYLEIDVALFDILASHTSLTS